MSKKRFSRLLILITGCLMLLGFSGCFTMNEDESEVPWSRQKDWEQQAPGMGR